jgi:hypothetical protein
MAAVDNQASVASKTESKLWAQWRNQYNVTLKEFESGSGSVRESVTYRETHKLLVPVAGGGRERYVSLEFTSAVEIKTPHTADGLLQGQGIARELAMATQLEWIDSVRERVLEYARERLKQGD